MFVKKRCYFVILETNSQKCVTNATGQLFSYPLMGTIRKGAKRCFLPPPNRVIRNAALSELMIQGTKIVLTTSLLQRNVLVYFKNWCMSLVVFAAKNCTIYICILKIFSAKVHLHKSLIIKTYKLSKKNLGKLLKDYLSYTYCSWVSVPIFALTIERTIKSHLQ